MGGGAADGTGPAATVTAAREGAEFPSGNPLGNSIGVDVADTAG
jgi:hypothetical protein